MLLFKAAFAENALTLAHEPRGISSSCPGSSDDARAIQKQKSFVVVENGVCSFVNISSKELNGHKAYFIFLICRTNGHKAYFIF